MPKASRFLGGTGSVKLPLSFNCRAKVRLGGGVDIKLADWLKDDDMVRRDCKGDDGGRLLAREVTGDSGCKREGGNDA